jgi:hypothetical protein
MIFGVFATGYLSKGEITLGNVFLFFTFVISFFISLYSLLVNRKERMLFIIYLLDSVFFLALAVLSLFGAKHLFVVIIGVVYGFSLIVNAILSLIYRHKVGDVIFNISKILFGLLLVLIFIAIPDSEDFSFLLLIPICFVVASFAHTMFIIFSGVKRQTLFKILKKTFAIEILYGLITLIVASGTMLYFIEDTFDNIGDALWYCFAVVTTIGFGDFVAKTVIGRLITVLLGIYGLVVVALLTSIIVNFYNETSAKLNANIDQHLHELEDKIDELDEKKENENTKEISSSDSSDNNE